MGCLGLILGQVVALSTLVLPWWGAAIAIAVAGGLVILSAEAKEGGRAGGRGIAIGAFTVYFFAFLAAMADDDGSDQTALTLVGGIIMGGLVLGSGEDESKPTFRR